MVLLGLARRRWRPHNGDMDAASLDVLAGRFPALRCLGCWRCDDLNPIEGQLVAGFLTAQNAKYRAADESFGLRLNRLADEILLSRPLSRSVVHPLAAAQATALGLPELGRGRCCPSCGKGNHGLRVSCYFCGEHLPEREGVA